MRAYLIGFAFVFAGSLSAQQFGSEDLGPYLPSPQLVDERMLEAAQLKPGETLYDLGSGDGRIVITAAQMFKANAVGVELSEGLCKSTLKKIAALHLDECQLRASASIGFLEAEGGCEILHSAIRLVELFEG